MALGFAEFAALYKANLQQDCLEPNGEFAENVFHNLREAGLLGDGLFLTQKGIKAVKAVKQKINECFVGVPLDKRIKGDPKEAEKDADSQLGWVYGDYKKKEYVTNGNILLITKSTKLMKAEKGSSTVRFNASTLIAKYCSGKPSELVGLEPYAYQVDQSMEVQLVWLVSRDKQVKVAVQAKYYDLVKEKFPAASFSIKLRSYLEGTLTPVLARVVGKGIQNNIMAIIMPMTAEPE